MAITQLSKIQTRKGIYVDLPVLSAGEFGYALDNQRLWIGNPGSTLPTQNTEILTENSPIPAPGGAGSNTQVIFNSMGVLGGSSQFTFDYVSYTLTLGGDVLPVNNNTQDFGSAAKRWNYIYTTNLSSGNTISAGAITGAWTLTTGSALIPQVDSAQDFGSNSKRWGVIYTRVITTGGSANVGGIEGQWSLLSGSAFIPQIDATQDLGSASRRWNDLYATSLTTGAAGNAGSVTGTWTLTPGSTFESTYSADLAEYYTSDIKYEPGTVVAFGGSMEVTLPGVENYTKIAGVVSTNPAYVLNTAIADQGVRIALAGRVPVKVHGKIGKGDVLYASIVHPGAATSSSGGGAIGRAIQAYDSEDLGTIEVMVNRI